MIIDDPNNKIEFNKAVNAIVKNGIVGVEGTKTHAVKSIRKLKAWLSEHHESIAPVTGFSLVENCGYLYYVFDANRFSIDDKRLDELIEKIDANYTL